MRELSMGGDLEVWFQDNEGYVLYWTVVCYHPYIVSRLYTVTWYWRKKG